MTSEMENANEELIEEQQPKVERKRLVTERTEEELLRRWTEPEIDQLIDLLEGKDCFCNCYQYNYISHCNLYGSSNTSTQGPSIPQLVDLTSGTPSAGASARRLFNAMADTASNNHQDDDDFVMFSPPMAGVYNTHRRQEKACIQVLNEEPQVVGDVSEVLDFFGLPSRTKKIKSYVQGRTEEVVSLIDKLVELEMNFPPCVTHSLDELLCQGVKDVAVCVLVIVDSLVSVEA
ncbi:uncharacterized protein LOC122947872, partial [Acropora millepora]|uniref:uncharacterized protein LOC122947872 n=1 Tax=Acropora millepora TaxID=45264 RepID=UPI001CF40B20